MSKVEVYSTQLCAHCWRVKNLLDGRGIAYIEIDAANATGRMSMIARTGGARTVPQVFVDGQYIGGADEFADYARGGGLEKLSEAD